MNHEFENIAEKYLQGKMSAAEAAQFEQSLAADPNKAADFELEKNIVEGVKHYRKQELKNYLNSIPVSTSPFSTTAVVSFLAAASIVAGLVAVFVSVNKSVTPQNGMPVVANTTTNHKEENSILMQQEAPKPVDAEIVVKEVEAPSAAVNKQVAENKSIASVSKPAASSAKSKSQTLPTDVSTEPLEVQSKDFEAKSTSSPALDAAVNETSHKANIAVDLAPSIKKGQIHYQYFNGKLFLFGNFGETPYDLLEINSTKTKGLYLVYQNKFYEIVPNTTDKTALEPIADKNLINSLKKSMKNND